MVEHTVWRTFIEVPLLLLFITYGLTPSITTNLVIYRTCYNVLGHNESDCAQLGKDNQTHAIAVLEKLVEKDAATINMVRGLIEGSLSVVICLFVGPWTDRFGRKLFLVIPLIGQTLGYSLYAIICALPSLSPWYFIVCTVPIILTGGISSYLTVVLAFITDVTSQANRGMRMGYFEAAITLGTLIGGVSSSYILYATNYTVVFLLAALLCLIATFVTVYCIPESLQPDNRETQGRVRGFFQLNNIREMFETTFKARPNYDRLVIILCMVTLLIYIMVVMGDSGVVFLFLREKFHWSLRHYTLYSSASSVIWIVGTIIGVYVLHKLMQVPETVLMVIGFISMLNGYLLQGMATCDSFIYAGTIVRSLGAVIGPMVRSLISKIIPAAEIGKVFCLILTGEFVFSMFSGPIYTAIYNATIDAGNEAFFNFVSAAFFGIGLVLTIVILVMRTIKPTAITVVEYAELNNDEEQNSEQIAT